MRMQDRKQVIRGTVPTSRQDLGTNTSITFGKRYMFELEVFKQNNVYPGMSLIRWTSRYVQWFVLRPMLLCSDSLQASRGHPPPHNLLTCSLVGGGKSGGGMFLSYFEPPGAAGGLYGSGCFHFTRSFSVSVNSNCIGCQPARTEYCRLARSCGVVRTFWCLGSYTFLLESKRDRM